MGAGPTRRIVTTAQSETLEWLEGRSYGPVSYRATVERIADFVAATGDDPSRWTAHAPPGFAAALLFSIAPEFLWSDDVAGHTRVLLHADQRFEWRAPFAAGDTYAVTGHVDRVRHRAGSDFVNFTVTAMSGGDAVMVSRSTFIMSAEDAGSPEPRSEPPVGQKAQDTAPWSGDGGPVAKSVSRSELVRYAAATGDWNPIHWDHDSALGAGVPGVIAHGLLMSSWMIQSAGCGLPGPHPLKEMRFRYKQPLAPATQATLVATLDAGNVAVTLSQESGDLVVATAVLNDET